MSYTSSLWLPFSRLPSLGPDGTIQPAEVVPPGSVFPDLPRVRRGDEEAAVTKARYNLLVGTLRKRARA
jgi:hypothetical protein